jgi:hypothetical protein
VSVQVAQRLIDPQHYGALCLLVDEAGFLLEKKTAALIAQVSWTWCVLMSLNIACWVALPASKVATSQVGGLIS